MNTSYKKGDQFKIIRTSRFGKEIISVLKVVCVYNDSLLMDDGSTIHLINLQ